MDLTAAVGEVLATSSPVWEAWIEIRVWSRQRQIHAWSSPVWEAWIEISYDYEQGDGIKSSPVWEAWIEIASLLQSLSGDTVVSRMGGVD